MATQVSLLDGALASAGTLAIQTNGTTSAITISSAQVATFVNNPIMTGLTASRAVFTDGSKGLTSNAITGTGNVVMSASPTLTGTIDGAALTLSSNLTLSAGTANGVLYLNGSKVATSGSALTFDGTNLGVLAGSVTTPAAKIHAVGSVRASTGTGTVYTQLANDGVYSTGTDLYLFAPTGYANIFYANNAEQMRLTSTGLGIGTTSPSVPLHVQANASGYALILKGRSAGGNEGWLQWTNNAGTVQAGIYSTSDNLVFANTSSNTERARIDSSGNFGIGTSSPSYKLDVDSTAGTVVSLNSTNASGPGLRFTRSGTANGYVGSAKYIVGGALADFGIDVSGANNLIFGTNDVERARIDSSGNFLVGTASQLGTSNARVNVSYDGSTLPWGIALKSDANNGIDLVFISAGNGAVGSISHTSTATSYNTSSDYRLKENIQPMTGALAFVRKQRPVTYNWKADGSEGAGYIAHWMQEDGAGNCVTGEKDAVDAEGNPQYQGIDTSFMVAPLNAAINELADIVDAQAAIIEQLKADVAALKGA